MADAVGLPAASAKTQGEEMEEPGPVLCTHCSKLPGEKGLPVRRGLWLPWCKHCGITACCDFDGPNGAARCKNDNTHQVVMTHTCEDCDANAAKNQVVLCANAIPYSFNLWCERSAPGCTEHLFEASCGHVFCSACLMRALPQLLAPRKAAGGEQTADVKHLADRFVTDGEDFIVPPCPLCYVLGVQRAGDEGRGCFALQTCRMLTPDTFLNLKSTANVAFHRRQDDHSDDDGDRRR